MRKGLGVFLVAVSLAGQVVPIPQGLDAYMPVPADNPLTAEKIRLGKRLFSDKRLSGDGTVSCASCHEAEYGFTVREAVGTGVRGQRGNRRPPRLINRGYGRSFFWDGRARSLEEQVLQPIANPVEMASTAEEAAGRAGVTVGEMRDALASYVRTMLSGGSRYDRYMAGEESALSDEEKAGMKLFSGKAGCAGCHVGPNLTDEKFHNTGVGTGDAGRFEVTRKESDRGAFKTPGLREVVRTAPFMHDGSLVTVAEVIDFYDKGGGTSANLDREIRPLHLTPDEKSAVVAFLRALAGTVQHGL